MLVRLLLEDQPHIEVLEADDGDTALEVVAAGAVDLIIMDMHMPGMDGLTATQLLRGRGVGAEIVAFTSSIDGRLSEAFLAEGASAHFDKGQMAALIAYIQAAARQAAA
jgi:CheY-like chemotaxis protein